MMGEKRTESLLVALAVSGVLVFSLTPSPLLRFGVSRLPALHRTYQYQGSSVANPGSKKGMRANRLLEPVRITGARTRQAAKPLNLVHKYSGQR